MYAVTKIRIKPRRLHTYTAEFCAQKCVVMTCADDVIDDAVNIKDDTTLCRCCKIYEEIDVSL